MCSLHVLLKIELSSKVCLHYLQTLYDFPHIRYILVEHETGLVHVHLVYAS